MPYIEDADILQATNGGLDIILSLYPDAAKSVDQPNRKFKTREEKTASAKLNRLPDGTYLVVDFGDDARSRNAIHCYVIEHACDWNTARNELASRYNIQGADPSKSDIKAIYSERPAESAEADGTWSYETRGSFNDIEIETIVSTKIRESFNWKSEDEKKAKFAHGHISDKLKEYHFHPMNSYSIIKNRKVMTFSASDKYPMFLIDEGTKEEGSKETDRFQKIYQPLHPEKAMRFMYIPGKKPKDFIHGLQQLNLAYDEHREQIEQEDKTEDGEKKKRKDDDYKLDEVILCTGGSDAINVALCGYRVLWLNSESAVLQQFQYDRIAQKVKKFYNLGDLDETGARQRHKLCMQYLDIYDIELPSELQKHYDKRGNPCKDVRDYFNHFKKKDFKLLVDYSAMPYRFWEKKAQFNKSGDFTGYDYKFRNEYAYNFLQRNGFYRLPVGDKETDFEYIQIEGNTVRVTSAIKIKAFVKDFLRSRHMDIDLRDEMHRTAQLNDSSLNSLDEIDIDFIDNEKGKQFLFFKNKTIEVTALGIIEHKPGAVKRFVWEDEVYPHRWQAPKEEPFVITRNELGEYDIEIKNKDCLFLKYLVQTSRAHWRKELEELLPKSKLTGIEQEEYLTRNKFAIDGELLSEDEIIDQKRHLVNKLFSIGYLMHRYKDRSKPWFIFAMDGKVNEDGQSHGGSGKSILYDVAMKTLLRKHFMLNGRNPKITDDPHKYDGLTEHHRYIFIDDAHEYLKLDVFYPDITGDTKVNPKGKKPYTITFDRSGKFSFSSNYTPKNLGPSTERRMIYNVFSDYYHNMGETTDYKESRDPSTEFGKQLFVEFNEAEWNNFYNTAVYALRFYLSSTEKITPAMGNVNRRNLMAAMGPVFYDWAKTYFSEESGKLDIFFAREEAYKDFVFMNNPQKFTAQTFKTKLAAFCRLEGYLFNPKKFLGKQGNIIQKVERKHYDARSNTWTPLPEMPKVATEMFYIQATHDLPDGIGEESNVSADELVKRRISEIQNTAQTNISFNENGNQSESKGSIDPSDQDDDFPIK